MTSLIQYIIQEGVNIKGFEGWCSNKDTLTKEELDGAKGDYNNLDNKVKDVLKSIASKLGIDFDDFDKNKSDSNDEDSKRVETDGETTSAGDDGGDEEGGDEEGGDEDEEKEKEELESPQNKEKVYLVKMAKNSAEYLNKSNADDFLVAVFKKYNLKSDDFLETFLEIILSAADKGIDWAPNSVIENDKLNELIHFVAFAKGLSDTQNKQMILDIQNYMGIE